uniref:HSF_DOMAIN domain-containing protein n=1 Tax=Panagrellus redivivus TaxID=6233 RepID=A0A7E4VYE5_PANRE
MRSASGLLWLTEMQIPGLGNRKYFQCWGIAIWGWKIATSIDLPMATRDIKQPTTTTTAPMASSTAAPAPLPVVLKEDDKIPLFLIKLWNIVEDPSYFDVIRWDDSGYSFHILDPYSFCRNVLPQYFKHNNLNSLIRQLNMYGFRKMTPIERTSLARAESDQDHLEFSHPCFVRDHPDLLSQIKRKTPTARRDDASNNSQNRDLSTILEEVRLLRDRQKTMEDRISDLTGDNHNLWQQLSSMRATHVKQQQIVNKLVQFLVTLVQPKRLAKRHMLAINDNGSAPKRFRNSNGTDATAAGGGGAGDNGQLLQIPTNNAHEVLDRLMREIGSSNYDFNFGDNNSPQNGPVISDVTDELDHLSTGQNDFLGVNVTDGGSMTGPSPQTQYDGNQQQQPQQQPQMSQPQGVYGYPNRLPPRIAMQPQQQQQQQIPQQQPLQMNMNQPSTISPVVTMPPQQPADPMLGAHMDDTSGANDHGLGFTAADFADYLSGVDHDIDNCRDLIGNEWNAFDIDNFVDNGQTDPSPPDGWNINARPLSLEATHPQYQFDQNTSGGSNDATIGSISQASGSYPSPSAMTQPSASPSSSTSIRGGPAGPRRTQAPIAPHLQYSNRKR